MTGSNEMTLTALGNHTIVFCTPFLKPVLVVNSKSLCTHYYRNLFIFSFLSNLQSK